MSTEGKSRPFIPRKIAHQPPPITSALGSSEKISNRPEALAPVANEGHKALKEARKGLKERGRKLFEEAALLSCELPAESGKIDSTLLRVMIVASDTEAIDRPGGPPLRERLDTYQNNLDDIETVLRE